MAQTAPVYITPEQLVERWVRKVSKGTLANWRSAKKGPPFVKFGGSVLYPLQELQEWEKTNLHAVNDNDISKQHNRLTTRL